MSASNYWGKRSKRETRFPNNYEYKSSSPKHAKTSFGSIQATNKDFSGLLNGAKRIAKRRK